MESKPFPGPWTIESGDPLKEVGRLNCNSVVNIYAKNGRMQKKVVDVVFGREEEI